MNKWSILVLVVLLAAIIYLRVVQEKDNAPASRPVQSVVTELEGVPLPPEAAEYTYRYVLPPPAAGGSVQKPSAAEEKAAKKEEIYQEEVKKDQKKLISELNKSLEAVFKKWKKSQRKNAGRD